MKGNRVVGQSGNRAMIRVRDPVGSPNPGVVLKS
jgi:hypothetical protein